jgi:hypothetical protein
MAVRDAGEAPDGFDARVRTLLSRASPDVAGTFLGLIAARAA